MFDIYTAKDYFSPSESFKKEIKRLARSPLKTMNPKNREFGSLKGRAVCALKFGQTILGAPFRLISAIVFAVADILGGIAVLFSFKKDSLRESLSLFKASISVGLGAAVQPLSLISDLTKLALGAIIHPAIAIK